MEIEELGVKAKIIRPGASTHRRTGTD